MKTSSLSFLPFIALLLIPAFISQGGIGVAQKVFFIFGLLSTLCFYLFHISITKLGLIPHKITFYIMFFMTIVIIISNLLNNGIADISSLLAISRYPIYFFIIISFYSFFRCFDFISIDKLIFIFFAVTSFFSMCQVFGVLTPFVKLYSDGYNSFLGLRVNSIFRYSYLYAVFLNFFFCFYLIKFQKEKKTYYIVFVIISLLFFILTQSKTAYLSLFVSILILYFVFIFDNNVSIIKKIWASSSFIIIAIVFLYIITSFYNEKIIHVLNFINYALNSGDMDGSTQTRFNQFKLAYDLLNNMGYDLLFGLGSNGTGNVILENAYLDYIVNYGILGFVLYILLLLSFVFHYGNNKEFFFGVKSKYNVAFLAMFISLFILAFSSSPTDAYRSSFLIYALLGLKYRVEEL